MILRMTPPSVQENHPIVRAGRLDRIGAGAERGRGKAAVEIRRPTDARTERLIDDLLQTRPNRDEIRGELERIRNAARAVPSLPPEERRDVVDPIVTFLRERFLPRADAEEAAIYPKLARAFSPAVTA